MPARNSRDATMVAMTPRARRGRSPASPRGDRRRRLHPAPASRCNCCAMARLPAAIAGRPGRTRARAWPTAPPTRPAQRAPSFGHSLLPDGATALGRWIVQQRPARAGPVRCTDSTCTDAPGRLRPLPGGDAGGAVADGRGPAFEHRHGRGAVAARQAPAVWLDDGRWLAADTVIVATGNTAARRPLRSDPRWPRTRRFARRPDRRCAPHLHRPRRGGAGAGAAG